jgi:uroporphyrinogen decarboxylase
MTSREIVTVLLRDKACPERMGVHEWFWQDTQREWERQGLPPGVDLFDHFNLDVREVQGSYFRTSGLPVDDRVIEDEGETVVKLNGWGACLREWKDRPGVPGHLSFDVTGADIWKRKYRDGLLELDLRRYPDWDGLKRSYARLKASDRFLVYHQMLLVEIMRRAMGDVVFLEAMVLDPAWVHDFCDVMTTNILLHWDYMLREVGKPDGLWTYDDMGYTQAPFLSPAFYREFLLPYHKRIADFGHDWGLPVVLHSCGRIRPLLPDIAAAGFDALHSIEAKAGQHLAEFNDTIRAGGRRMALVGNLDIRAFEANDPNILEAEILPKLDAVRAARLPYIFFSDHSIPKSVNLRTYEYALELFWKHGRYGRLERA